MVCTTLASIMAFDCDLINRAETRKLFERSFMSQPLERPSSRLIRRRPYTGIAFLGGIAVGAALVYLFEPRVSARHRALLRDKTRSLANRSFRLGGKLSRHLSNRVRGLIAISTDALRQQGIDSDPKIESRVRATLGRTIPHPHAVVVTVLNGHVSLRGTLHPHEAGLVVRATERVRGVKGVENLLTPPMQEGASPIQ
jgi:hypothetical protein